MCLVALATGCGSSAAPAGGNPVLASVLPVEFPISAPARLPDGYRLASGVGGVGGRATDHIALIYRRQSAASTVRVEEFGKIAQFNPTGYPTAGRVTIDGLPWTWLGAHAGLDGYLRDGTQVAVLASSGSAVQLRADAAAIARAPDIPAGAVSG